MFFMVNVTLVMNNVTLVMNMVTKLWNEYIMQEKIVKDFITP